MTINLEFDAALDHGSQIGLRQYDPVTDVQVGADIILGRSPVISTLYRAANVPWVESTTYRSAIFLAAGSVVTGTEPLATALTNIGVDGGAYRIGSNDNLSLVYPDGAIWVNTNAANTGTVVGFDGTISHPVSTLAAARAIADAAKIPVLKLIARGQRIVAAFGYSDLEIVGIGGRARLDLGDQSFINLIFRDVDVIGGAGAIADNRIHNSDIHNGQIGNGVTISDSKLYNCLLVDQILVQGSKNIIYGCSSGHPSVPTSFSCEGQISSTLVAADWSGAAEIDYLGAGGSEFHWHFSGDGTVTLNATCTGGFLHHSAGIRVVDNSTGAGVTVVEIGDESAAAQPTDGTYEITADGDILTTGWTRVGGPAENFSQAINEGFPTTDADYVYSFGNSNILKLDLQSLPADLNEATTIELQVRARGENNDPFWEDIFTEEFPNLQVQIFKADGTTGLTAQVTIMPTGLWATYTSPLTILGTPANSDWTGSQIHITPAATYAAGEVELSAFTLSGEYSLVPPPAAPVAASELHQLAILERLPAALINGRMPSDMQSWAGSTSLVSAVSRLLSGARSQSANGGTTTTLIDDSRIEAEGHWVDALLAFSNGPNAGHTARVTAFDAATNTLTFAPAVHAAVTTDSYALIPGLGRSASASAMAAEFAAIKGAGWTTETLKNIRDNLGAGGGGGGGGDATAANQDLLIAAVAALPADIEASLLNEGDGQQLIDAILQVINNNLDLPALELAAIAVAVRVELATELARIDAAVSTVAPLSGPQLLTTLGLETGNLDAQFAALEGFAGTGASTVTLTIRDTSSAPLAGASVRLAHATSGSSAFGITAADGTVTLACDDYADWQVAITKTGFVGAIATLIVSGVTSQTYQLVANYAPTPSAPGTASGFIMLLDCDGTPLVGADYTTQYVSGGALAGVSPCRDPFTVQTDAQGIAEFVGQIHGATYRPWRGNSAAGAGGALSPFSTRNSAISKTYVVPAVSSFNIQEAASGA